MKSRIFSNSVYGVLLALLANHSVADENSLLRIEIQGLKEPKGEAVFVLMDSEASHRGKAPVFHKESSTITNLSVSAEFTLPRGEYSAVVYHDVNANGKLDTYFYGKPKEPYGFSNEARNAFGIPDFAEASFIVNTDPTHLTITVK